MTTQRKSPGGGGRVANFAKKVGGVSQRVRGRMTGLAEREQRVQWTDEAVQAGARLAPACAEADISIRSHQRWLRGVSVIADARPRAQRPTPANKLSAAERAAIIACANEARFASLPPSQSDAGFVQSKNCWLGNLRRRKRRKRQRIITAQWFGRKYRSTRQTPGMACR